MTGVITKADNPGLPSLELVGGRVGITVDDRGPPGSHWLELDGYGFLSGVGVHGTAPFFPVSNGDLAVDSPRG